MTFLSYTVLFPILDFKICIELFYVFISGHGENKLSRGDSDSEDSTDLFPQSVPPTPPNKMWNENNSLLASYKLVLISFICCNSFTSILY